MKPRHFSKFAQSSVFLGISLLPVIAFGATIGLNFSSGSGNQVSDGQADFFGNWTDSTLVPEGNFQATGTNASLKGGGPVRVTWQSSNQWGAGSSGDNDQQLYSQYLDDGNTGGGIGVKVTANKMARWLALNEHTSYQIRCYANNDNGNTYQPISIRNGGTSGTVLETITVVALGNGDYPTSGVGTPASGQSRGYIDSSSTLTADTVSMTILPRPSGSSTRGTLCAFKITGVGTGPPVDHFESGDGMVSVIRAALGSGLTSEFRANLDTPTVTGSFSVIPTHKIKVIQPSGGFTANTTYDLLKLPATTSVNLSNLSLSTLPRGTVGQLEMVDNGGTNPVLRLNVTEMNVPSALYWTGNIAGGAWNIDGTVNWSYESSPSTYLDGDEVVFDDSVTGTTAVTLNVPVLPFSVKVDNDATHPYTITGSGTINGAGTFTKLGAGPLTLATANAYAGITSIQAGAVTLGSNNALGSAATGTTVADGASLDLNGRDINGEALTLSGSGADGNGVLVNSSASPAAATGSITLNGATTIGGSGEINLGTIGGSSGSLIKSGSSQVSTATPFGFNGSFTVDEGTWVIAGGNTLNTCSETIINNGGILRSVGDNKPFGSGPSAANKITLNEGGILSTPNSSCHLGTLVFDGGTLSADTINTDWANYNLDQSVSTPGTGKTSTITGGNVTVSQSGGTIFNIGAGDTLAISAKIDGDTGAADNGLIKNGPGTLLLTNTHTYDSATTVNGGTLRVDGSADRTASVTVAAAGTVAGSGSLAAVGATTIDGTVAPGSPASPQGTLSLGTTTLNGSLAASISGAACSQLSVTGNLTLGAAAAVTLSGTPTAPVYTLATCSGTLSGTFTTAAPAGYHFAYSPTSVSLVSNSAGYASWIGTSGLAPADQGMNADPDHDGVANGLEYVLGGNPATGMDAAKLPAGQLSGGNFVFSFDRTVSSETPDIALSFQHGTDLVGWTTITVDAANPPTVTITRSGDNLTDHVVVTLPASGTTKFGRLKVTTP